MKKILVILVLLVLIAASVFGDTACMASTCGRNCSNYTGRAKATVSCYALSESACSNYYQTYYGGWSGHCTGPPTICNSQSVLFLCTWDSMDMSCGGWKKCVGTIPEFMGIEFNEMQFSTGLVALVGAVAVGMIITRRKKDV